MTIQQLGISRIIDEKQTRWDKHFLQMCLDHARMSKDPSTKCGAVIVGEDNEVITVGFNGFPRNMKDTQERLNNREEKLKRTLHAEVNAIISAARTHNSTKGATMYILGLSGDLIWGGPCFNCAIHIIQAGISEVVVARREDVPTRWSSIMNEAQEALLEASVSYRVVPRNIF